MDDVRNELKDPTDPPLYFLTSINDPTKPAGQPLPETDELAGLGDPSDLVKLCVMEEDAHDLAICQDLVNTMVVLQTMMGEEAEIVKAESWNFDTAVELIKVAQGLGQIPFGGGTPELFDVQPTLNSEGREHDAKGKGRQRDSKRTIFNLHPKDSMDVWLGKIPSKQLSTVILHYSVILQILSLESLFLIMPLLAPKCSWKLYLRRLAPRPPITADTVTFVLGPFR